MQNVWLMGGLSVLTSVATTPQPVCLLCASKGRHEVNDAQSMTSTECRRKGVYFEFFITLCLYVNVAIFFQRL